MKVKLFVFLYCLMASLLNGQQLFFFKPEKLKQIPSSETYNIMQDSKGYIWFSSEAGLCRYNGNSLKVFDTKNGLPEAATYVVKEHNNKELYIVTSGNRILQYKNDELIEASFSKAYGKVLLNPLEQTSIMDFIDDTIILNTQHITYRAKLNSAQAQKVEQKEGASYFCFLKTKEGLVRYNMIKRGNSVVKQIIAKQRLDVSIISEKGIQTFPVPFKRQTSPPWRTFSMISKKGESFIAFGSTLIRIKPDGTHLIQEFAYDILSLYIDSNDGLWVGTHKGGLNYYPDASDFNKKLNNLYGYSVSGVCEDFEKGIWCTTLEKGVLYCRNKKIIDLGNTQGLEKKAELLRTVDNRIYVSTAKNEILEIDRDTIIKHRLDLKDQYIISDVLKLQNNSWLISGKDFIVRSADKFKSPYSTIRFSVSKLNASAAQLTLGPDYRAFSIQFGHFSEIIGDEMFNLKSPMEHPGKCITYSQTGHILIGCKDGVLKVELNDTSIKKIPGIKGTVSKILDIPGIGTIIATKGDGLYLLNGDSLSSLSQRLQIPTTRFLDVSYDRYGSVWVASNIGLIQIVFLDKKPEYHVYNSLNGLPSDEIYNIAVDEKDIFLSTNVGLCRMPLNIDLVNHGVPGIILSNVFVNDNELKNIQRSLVLKHNENSLKFSFDVLTFKSEEQKILYRLNGKTSLLDGNTLTLSHLTPGKYNLEVFAINNDKRAGSISETINFVIEKPYWRTAWFLLSVVFLAGIMAGLFTLRIVKRIKKKEEEKTRISKLIAEYQMSALRAQMNPHFIFNCINSIQSYILTNKPEKAYDYLSKFSKLIRLVLNYADENLIRLEQELQIVELYMELEQQRFDNKFAYTIHVGETINTAEAKVPAMILQPYIENAIWHGLMNLEKGQKGLLSIHIDLEDENLKILVEDNGVGRERAAQLSPSRHIPKATSINSRRSEILGLISEKKGSITIEDIRGNGNLVLGTRVTILIPQNENVASNYVYYY
jgi:ligand-binding sensor domain-containing protein